MRNLPRVLIVEDEPAIAELMAVNLRHNGFQPVWAMDAESAQKELDEVLPDVILLDWMLPGESGLSLAKRWRGHARTKAVPILMITARGIIFLAETHVQADPSAEAIADTVLLCARHVARFGITPKAALVAHSDFGDFNTPHTLKMRDALALVRARAPEIEIDGEMQADTALIEAVRQRKLPSSTLKGEANLLIMPDLSSANAAYQMIKVFGDALPVGPILLGAAQPAHILTGSVTSRGVVNMTAIAVAEAATLA
jgi:phosphotransacetylase